MSDQPLRLSWSKLRTHEECFQKLHQQSLGHRSAITDIRMFFPGTVVDRCMRRWLELDEQAPGWMASMVDEILEFEEADAKATGDGIVRWKGPRDKANVRDFCRELVTALEPDLLRLVVPFEYQPALRFEVPLSVPYLDDTPRQITLVGEMDLLVRSQGTQDYRVWDLKATKNASYWRKTLGQLLFYEIACKLMTGYWPSRSGLLQPMCPDPVLEFDFQPEQHREMLVRIARTAQDIWGGKTAPKEGTEGCGWCNVRHACVRYKLVAPGRQPAGSRAA